MKLIHRQESCGKQPGSLRVKLEVPKDAPLGYHAVRLATRGGMSNARLFCIDDLPQVLQKAGNTSEKGAQRRGWASPSGA